MNAEKIKEEQKQEIIKYDKNTEYLDHIVFCGYYVVFGLVSRYTTKGIEEVLLYKISEVRESLAARKKEKEEREAILEKRAKAAEIQENQKKARLL